MKNIIVAILLLVSVTTQAGEPLTIAVTDIHDGDTFSISVLLPTPLNELSVRLLGVDTPEVPADSYAETGKLSRSGCVAEAELALKAKQFVKDLIVKNGGVVTISNYKWDKYGGRIDADVMIGDVDLAKALLSKGYAVEYYGVGPRHNWCQ